MKDETVLAKPKRKKISRACNHCHKAHMTCDTNRPCKRCILRGLQETCEDAPRKRKKYLADVPPSLILPQRDSGSEDLSDRSTLNDPHVFQATKFQHSALLPNYTVHTPSHLARTTTVDGVKKEHAEDDFSFYQGLNVNAEVNTNNGTSGTNGTKNNEETNKPRKRTNFLSLAADLEYSTLSSILQDNFMGINPNLATSTEGTPNSVNLSPALSPHGLGLPKNSPTILANYPDDYDKSFSTNIVKSDNRINQYFLGITSAGATITFPEVIQAIESMKNTDPAAYYVRNSELTISFTIGLWLETASDENLEFKEPEEIYARVNLPFSYTPGFHKLIAYLRRRFPRDMLVKMAESMAVYRPSFIACTNSLREADLIFMEQCFQRTLLTYDKFLRVSGTPTIVWRRTGEIAYVGTEFTVLTGWTHDQLMGDKPMFIVEVLDDKSVVEYFQLFSKIAFGDFLGATMTECTLLTPQKDVKIRAGCIWTLKRDVFGIPMMIIGNFLPIL